MKVAPASHHATPGPPYLRLRGLRNHYYAITNEVKSLNNEQRRRRVGKPQTVTPESPNLVSTWRAIATKDDTLTEALETMNRALGMKLTHSRVAEWEQEEKAPSTRVVNYMLATVIPALVIELGQDERQAMAVASQLRIPGI